MTEEDLVRLAKLEAITIDPVTLTSLPASYLEPLCRLRQLRRLAIVRSFVGLPACIGELKDMQHLDVRGNHFTTAAAMPESMNQLTNLVEFIAFGQHTYTYQGPNSPCTNMSCVPNTAVLSMDVDDQKDVENQESPRWRCGSLKADLEDLPIWRWSKLEKFWVDMNHLSFKEPASFFDRVVEAWPRLRTLDLYDNDIEVDIAHVKKLKKLPHLHQLLLQNNRVYGQVDGCNGTFFADWPPSWQDLDIRLNKGIGGCVNHHEIPKYLNFNWELPN